ncbi:Calsyntenin, partial [Brachionus plicatilis]
ENGFEPFKDIVIMKIDQPSDEPFSNEVSGEDLSDESNMLSKCAIKIMPERNLMAPSLNNEKVMFLQNLLDEYGFRFEETLNSVLISGPSSIKNYENFIRHLTFVVININEVDEASLDLIRNKKFLISCTSLESKVDSSAITVQVNLAKSESVKIQAENIAGPVAHKQLQSFVVSENDDDIVKKSSHLVPQNGPTSPIVFAILVVASCSIGFVLVFGAIKMYTSRTGGRKQVPNEENPQMEWDDSGLNITENPLDTLEVTTRRISAYFDRHTLTKSI